MMWNRYIKDFAKHATTSIEEIEMKTISTGVDVEQFYAIDDPTRSFNNMLKDDLPDIRTPIARELNSIIS